ncbi:Uncharacterized protein Rs2_08753 [Raphanus sativus]|nr:Uncharacterized protein Rs2_08753 [Raphanus sativus]
MLSWLGYYEDAYLFILDLESSVEPTEQTLVEEGPLKPVRNKKPHNLDVEVKEETKTKRSRVSKEKPRSNAMMPSKPNRINKCGRFINNSQIKNGNNKLFWIKKKMILKMLWEASINKSNPGV